MNRFSVVLTWSAFCVQAMSTAAIYQQPPVWSGNGANVGFSSTSHVGSTLSGYNAFDNFTLGSAAVVNQVSWYGIYLSQANTDGAPNTEHWNINFLTDNVGTPGTALSGTALTLAQVTQSAVGSGFFGANAVTVYQFSANINAFSASAGTQYWFNVLNSANNTSFPAFAWIAGSGGDNLSYQWTVTNGAITATASRPGDRAFSLSNSSATPEPSTMLMGASGLLGMVLLRLRRRRQG